MTLRVIIMDNNKTDRKMLEGMLKRIPGITLEESVDDYSALVKSSDLSKPHLIFMYAGFPEAGQVVAHLEKVCPKVFIVFTGPFEIFNRSTLEIFVFHRLFKPLMIEQVGAIIDRVKFIMSDFSSMEQAEPASSHTNNRETGKNKFAVETEDGLVLVDINNILIIKKEDRKTGIYTHNEMYKVNESLDHMESRLGDQFFRCHKGFIINVELISSIIALANRTYAVRFNASKMTALMTAERLKLFQQIYCIEKYF